MSAHSEVEMSETVREGVLQCLHARDRMHCLDQFMRRLVDHQGWSQVEANEVGESTIDVLRRIAGHIEPEPDEANRSAGA
jgi:hypothetical protein